MFKINQSSPIHHSTTNNHQPIQSGGNNTTVFSKKRLLSNDELLDVLDSSKRQSTMDRFGSFGGSGSSRKQLMFFSKEETEQQNRDKRQKQMTTISTSNNVNSNNSNNNNNNNTPVKILPQNNINNNVQNLNNHFNGRRTTNLSLFDSDFFLDDEDNSTVKKPSFSSNSDFSFDYTKSNTSTTTFNRPIPPQSKVNPSVVPSPSKPVILPLKTPAKPLPIIKLKPFPQQPQPNSPIHKAVPITTNQIPSPQKTSNNQQFQFDSSTTNELTFNKYTTSPTKSVSSTSVASVIVNDNKSLTVSKPTTTTGITSNSTSPAGKSSISINTEDDSPFSQFDFDIFDLNPQPSTVNNSALPNSSNNTNNTISPIYSTIKLNQPQPQPIAEQEKEFSKFDYQVETFNTMTCKPKSGIVNNNTNPQDEIHQKQSDEKKTFAFTPSMMDSPIFTQNSILKPLTTTPPLSSLSSSISVTPPSSSITTTTTTTTSTAAANIKSNNNNSTLNDQFEAFVRDQKDKSVTKNQNTYYNQKGAYTSEEIKENIPHEMFRNVALMLKDTIVDIRHADSYLPDLQPLPSDMNKQLSNALHKMGYQQLYSHQLECRQQVLSGKDVIITTPTSSGKSLCLFIPIFEYIINQKIRGQKSSTALFLFPLNALANNQIKSINHFNTQLDAQYRLKIRCINGDTEKNSIPDIFQEPYPDIIMTNPDWLHYQLQRGGHHERWKGWRHWFAKLKFIVLDEAHTYSGVMGCHFINLLRRVTNYHSILLGNSLSSASNNNNNSLQYLLASATIGNPKQMAMKMISRKDESNIKLVDRNGSGSFGKFYLTLKSFKNPYQMPCNVIRYWMENNLKGIVFCNTIKGLNGLMQYLATDGRFSNFKNYVKAYYSSLTNKQETLNQLKTGHVKVIVATNALEAGVDIPELDACLILGYPGSKMSWKQRVGRVGRSKKGLVVFIPTTYSPLDKFYAQNMSSLLDGDTESLSFNGDFPTILSSHLLCASNEIGIPVNNQLLENTFGPQAVSIMENLLKQNKVKSMNFGNRFLWKSSDYIHNKLSIRGGTGLNDVVNARIGTQNGTQIEQMSKLQAISRLFPGAIFITHNSENIESYEVKELNLSTPGSNGTAILKKITLPRNSRVSTTPRQTSNIEMLSVLQQKIIPLSCGPSLQLTFGVARYSTIVNGYEKRTYNQAPTTIGSKSIYDDSCFNSSCESESVTLKTPFEVNYEAPCLEFTFQDVNNTKTVLGPIFKQKIDDLKHRLQNNLYLSRKENEPIISHLLEMGEIMVSLHTIVHQILATVPSLLLTSRNDVEESIPNHSADGCCDNNGVQQSILGRSNRSIDLNNLLGRSVDRIYLVDNTEGGTGCCQDIFDNLEDIIRKCIELPPCPSCNEEFENDNLLSEDFGCQFCIHSNHCYKGLLKSMGVSLFIDE